MKNVKDVGQYAKKGIQLNIDLGDEIIYDNTEIPKFKVPEIDKKGLLYVNLPRI